MDSKLSPEEKAQRALNSALSLPGELQVMIGKGLHGPSLLKAVRTGLQVDESTMLRAQHTYIWSSFLDDKDFPKVEKAIQHEGNIFILGYGIRRLYEEAFIQRHKPASETTHLILSFLPKGLILPEKLRSYEIYDIKCSHPSVSLTLEKVNFHNNIEVRDLGKYLQNDNGRLWTSIVYFKDKSWGVYDVDVKFVHAYEEGVFSQYKYALEINNLRKSRCGWQQSDQQMIYLQDDIRNDVENPQKPWHLATNSNIDKGWWEDLVTSTKAKGRWQNVFGSNRGWWEWGE